MPSERMVEALAGLWQAMLGIFGHAWSSQYGINATNPRTGELTKAGLAWAEAIRGLTRKQLAAGVLAAQHSGQEFPPGASVFRVLALGLPSLAEIELQLSPGQDRSGFAVLVWSRVDAYRYRSADGRDQSRMVRAAYDGALRFVLGGGAVPQPAAAAIAYERPAPPTVADRERARQALQRAASELGMAPAGEVVQ